MWGPARQSPDLGAKDHSHGLGAPQALGAGHSCRGPRPACLEPGGCSAATLELTQSPTAQGLPQRRAADLPEPHKPPAPPWQLCIQASHGADGRQGQDTADPAPMPWLEAQLCPFPGSLNLRPEQGWPPILLSTWLVLPCPEDRTAFQGSGHGAQQPIARCVHCTSGLLELVSPLRPGLPLCSIQDCLLRLPCPAVCGGKQGLLQLRHGGVPGSPGVPHSLWGQK